jgi:Ner family transcriptional regulator
MPSSGWHRADVVAALHKRGTSLSQLGRDNGLHDSSLRAALSYPRKPSNKIIADFLGKSLHELWPAWFDSQGQLTIGEVNRRQRQASSQKRGQKLSLAARRA